MKSTPRVLTCAQVRELDRTAIQEFGIPSMVLMENAGRGVAEIALTIDPRLAEEITGEASQALILCGKGNNGGDGLVVARHLEIRGALASVVLLAPPNEFEGDAGTNLRILGRCRTPIFDLSQLAPLHLLQRLDELAVNCLWLVDALLGTGAQGDPRQPYATAIEWMNRQSARRLAIDLPSGLDGDSGEAHCPTVRADMTVTLAALKPGLVAPQARAWTGVVHVASIGLPYDLGFRSSAAER